MPARRADGVFQAALTIDEIELVDERAACLRGQALGRLGRRLGRLLLLLCRRCLFIAIADVDHLGHFGKMLHAFAGALVQLARNGD